MRAWAVMLGGPIVWAAHFLTLYAIASLFPGDDLARHLALAATVPALGADAALLLRARRAAADGRAPWNRTLGALGAGVSALAVAWQALPAILA